MGRGFVLIEIITRLMNRKDRDGRKSDSPATEIKPRLRFPMNYILSTPSSEGEEKQKKKGDRICRGYLFTRKSDFHVSDF